jgi:hypothetical protein
MRLRPRLVSIQPRLRLPGESIHAWYREPWPSADAGERRGRRAEVGAALCSRRYLLLGLPCTTTLLDVADKVAGLD